MALKIVRASEPITVEQIVVCIYGAPGLGKTTLGFSADKPLMLDFDRGAYRSANRGDSVQIDSWGDVTEITTEDLASYNTVVVDTAGRALDVLSADIIRRNPKMGRGGALTLQGFGQLKSEFVAWTKHIRTMGKDLVLITHASEEKSGDEILERLDVQGGSKGEIYKSADAMGRLSLSNGKRVLNFNPSDTAFGKNPGQFNPLPVPDIFQNPHFLAEVIGKIKDKLNALSEAQKERQENIAQWLAKFEQAESVEQFNALVTECQEAAIGIQPTIKGALHKEATKQGYVFDKKQGCYTVAA